MSSTDEARALSPEDRARHDANNEAQLAAFASHPRWDVWLARLTPEERAALEARLAERQRPAGHPRLTVDEEEPYRGPRIVGALALLALLNVACLVAAALVAWWLL